MPDSGVSGAAGGTGDGPGAASGGCASACGGCACVASSGGGAARARAAPGACTGAFGMSRNPTQPSVCTLPPAYTIAWLRKCVLLMLAFSSVTLASADVTPVTLWCVAKPLAVSVGVVTGV